MPRERRSKYANDAKDTVGIASQVESLSSSLAQRPTVSQIRENTDIRPINVSEMDTETKALFTGGAVAIVGENAVGEENIKRGAIPLLKLEDTNIVIGKNLYKYDRDFKLGWISSDGLNINDDPIYGRAVIPVLPNQIYSIRKSEPDAFAYHLNGGATLFLGSSGNTLEIINGQDYVNGIYNSREYITLTTPVGCYYIAMNVKMSSYDSSQTLLCISGDKITDTIMNNPKVTKLFGADLYSKDVEDLKNSITYIGGNIYSNADDYTNNFYVGTDGLIHPATGWGFAKIPVIPQKQYSIWLENGDYTPLIGAIAFNNSSNTLISYIVDATSKVNGQYNGKNFITLTTPDNCTYILITCKVSSGSTLVFDNSQSLIACEGTTVNPDKVVTGINGAVITSESPTTKSYAGLKWTVVGDSLTEKNLRTTLNYHDYVAEELGFTVVNMGSSGTGYKKEEENNKAFYQRIVNIPTDTDVVTIFGSGNDWGLYSVLGEVTDTTTATVCGCINKTIDNLYNILPTVRLGIITPTPWIDNPPTNPGNPLEVYSEKLKEICKRRGIPCLDLYHESGLRPWDATFRTLAYSKDEGNGVHPDETGHKMFAPKVKEFVKSLI
jgi:lysophospholipase L1-like esterase